MHCQRHSKAKPDSRRPRPSQDGKAVREAASMHDDTACAWAPQHHPSKPCTSTPDRLLLPGLNPEPWQVLGSSNYFTHAWGSMYILSGRVAAQLAAMSPGMLRFFANEGSLSCSAFEMAALQGLPSYEVVAGVAGELGARARLPHLVSLLRGGQLSTACLLGLLGLPCVAVQCAQSGWRELSCWAVLWSASQHRSRARRIILNMSWEHRMACSGMLLVVDSEPGLHTPQLCSVPSFAQQAAHSLPRQGRPPAHVTQHSDSQKRRHTCLISGVNIIGSRVLCAVSRRHRRQLDAGLQCDAPRRPSPLPGKALPWK